MMQRFVQLALDLFDPPAAASAGQADSRQKKPQEPKEQASVAPEDIANGAPPEAARLPDMLAPASFRHPRANREVLLDGAVVAWILRKLGEARERQQRLEHARIVWRDGALLPYLGAPLRIVLDPAQSAAGQLREAGEGGARQLHIGLPASAQPEQIRDAVQAWLMRSARRHFTARLEHFAPLLGVRWTRLRLSSAQTRWGSARADGSINLNWRLLHYPGSVIDYVVAHELANLRVMDHSPRFWDTVRTVVPDYAALRRHLHDEPAPLWD